MRVMPLGVRVCVKLCVCVCVLVSVRRYVLPVSGLFVPVGE